MRAAGILLAAAGGAVAAGGITASPTSSWALALAQIIAGGILFAAGVTVLDVGRHRALDRRRRRERPGYITPVPPSQYVVLDECHRWTDEDLDRAQRLAIDTETGERYPLDRDA
jgi:hypothetical protein